MARRVRGCLRIPAASLHIRIWATPDPLSLLCFFFFGFFSLHAFTSSGRSREFWLSLSHGGEAGTLSIFLRGSRFCKDYGGAFGFFFFRFSSFPNSALFVPRSLLLCEEAEVWAVPFGALRGLRSTCIVVFLCTGGRRDLDSSP